MQINSRKHWYAYTTDVLLILIFGIPAVQYYYKTQGATTMYPYFRIGVLVFGIWILYKSIRGIILNLRVKWIFKNNRLTVKSGFLPWRRTNFGIDISQIYEAFYSTNFIGTLLGYGSLQIRRTDGVTSKVMQYKMSNHKKIISSINNCIILNKENKSHKTQTIISKESVSDELRKLADLNRDGVISEDEFTKLKRKIIE